MAAKKDNARSKSSWVPPFLSGLVVGTILVSCVYYFGVRNFDPDTDFLRAFPDIENTFPNISFEFPKRLQDTDPERVGAESEPTVPQLNIDIPVDTENRGAVTPPADRTERPNDSELTPESQDSITGYVLQAGAFAEKKHADSFRASLLIEGYNAFTKQITDIDSAVQYRVIVGPYDTIEKSREDSSRLKARNISTFVIPMREVAP